MQNRWTTSGDELVEWTAYLTPAAERPQQLLEWIRVVLGAGEQQHVYRVDRAPLAGFRADRDGPFDQWLVRRWNDDGVLDLGFFATSGVRAVDGDLLRVTADLAFADSAGAVRQDEVSNVGALLRELRPDRDPETSGLIVDCPPIDLRGPLVNIRRPDESVWGGRPGYVEVRVSLRTDIWFPWVTGIPDRAADQEIQARFDNRPLAERHTPRLNAFLGACRSATTALGGRWEREPEDRLALPGMLDEHGVRLDAPVPPPARAVVQQTGGREDA